MQSDGTLSLSLLHDLALLYLGLAHGADQSLAPTEVHTIAIKLRQWQPDKDPALIDHVIREAILTYLNGPTADRLQDAADLLGGILPENLRAAILQDLMDIARADGTVRSEEGGFIKRIAELWGEKVQQG
jgi:uncharacterized tellurite resistance protein B-like protein